MKKMFINWGNSLMEGNRFLVDFDEADDRFHEMCKKVEIGGYVSLNKTYTSFDGTLEQGDLVKYYQKK